MTSISPPPSTGMTVSVISAISVSAGRDRRRGAARRVLGARRVLAARAAPAVRRAVEVARLRVAVAALPVRVAARFVVDAARRRVVVARVDPPRAIWRACLVRLSMRLRRLLTSARVLALLTCPCSCLIAARAVLSASFSLLSSCRRRSGGMRLSASRSALRPALTARPTRLERRGVHFFFAMQYLHQKAQRAL